MLGSQAAGSPEPGLPLQQLAQIDNPCTIREKEHILREETDVRPGQLCHARLDFQHQRRSGQYSASVNVTSDGASAKATFYFVVLNLRDTRKELMTHSFGSLQSGKVRLEIINMALGAREKDRLKIGWTPRLSCCYTLDAIESGSGARCAEASPCCYCPGRRRCSRHQLLLHPSKTNKV